MGYFLYRLGHSTGQSILLFSMSIKSCFLFLKKIITEQRLPSLGRLLSLVVLLILSAGCSQASLTVQQLPSLIPDLSTEANFSLRVKPSSRSGIYTVAGSTNLPDNSRITVAAVRYLRPDRQVSQNSTPTPTFSILAYQDVEVNQGKWQTSLGLWKPAPDGRFKEAWQLDQAKLGLTFVPETEVNFLATVEPTDSLADLETRLKKQGIKLVSDVVRNTAEGEQYVQALQVLPVALPTASTVPPQLRPEDVNGGWGPRYLLLPEPPNINNLERPGKRRTDAPLSPDELLQ